MIEVRDLTKIYPPDKLALDRVNLKVGAGEFAIILGRSGAGKSTLLRCLNRLVEPSAGEVFWDGMEMTATSREVLRKVRREIGMIFQQFNLVKRATVLENVLAGRLGYAGALKSLFGRFSVEDELLALECLEQVGLAGFSERRAGTLSGGEQQRVAIARALAQRPRVILADEPTASLDPRLTQTIMDILKRINEEKGITLIISQHQLEVAMEYGERIVGLRSGRVLYDGSVSDLGPEAIEAIYGGEEGRDDQSNSRTFGH